MRQIIEKVQAHAQQELQHIHQQTVDKIAGSDQYNVYLNIIVIEDFAEKAIQTIEQQGFSLSNKIGLVIGNGNMGQLAAQQLMKRDCTVYITLRAHHNSSSIVPFGAIPVPYEKRMQYVAQSDLVISATRSPHYKALTKNQVIWSTLLCREISS